MKNFLLLLWSIILVVIFSIYFFRKTDEVKPEYNFFHKDFHLGLLDSILAENKYVVITIGASECSPCSILLNCNGYKNLPYPKWYFDYSKTGNNRLISQILNVDGYPTSFLIGEGYNIHGIIYGAFRFFEQNNPFLDNNLCDMSICNDDDCIHHKHHTCDTYSSISYNEKMLMLSDALKATFYMEKNDLSSARVYANSSLNYGAYFYNIYFLLFISQKEEQQALISYYKDKLLSCVNLRDSIIFSNLLEQITN